MTATWVAAGGFGPMYRLAEVEQEGNLWLSCAGKVGEGILDVLRAMQRGTVMDYISYLENRGQAN